MELPMSPFFDFDEMSSSLDFTDLFAFQEDEFAAPHAAIAEYSNSSDNSKEEPPMGRIINSLKVKNGKINKKEKQPKVAFITRTEIDHLEDGYRWRKYGQKAVKNSPFPRSYYKCTNASCNVKKRVERSCEDPTIVVTTYEGQHTHLCPAVTGAVAAMPATLQSSVYPWEEEIVCSQNGMIPSFTASVNCGFSSCSESSSDPYDGLLQDLVQSWQKQDGLWYIDGM